MGLSLIVHTFTCMRSSVLITVLNKALNSHGTPKTFNIDQARQYTLHEHIQLLLNHRIKVSMNGISRATDNTAIDRFQQSRKYENIYLHEYKKIKTLKTSTSKYINFYNHRHIHQTLNDQKLMDVDQNSIQMGLHKAA